MSLWIPVISVLIGVGVPGWVALSGKRTDSTLSELKRLTDEIAQLKADAKVDRANLKALEAKAAHWETREGLWDFHCTRLEALLMDAKIDIPTRPQQLTGGDDD